MSLSVVGICNLALQKLGAASISTLADNSREARQCSLAYESCRRAELRKHTWNFAVTRAVLAPDSDAPAFDYLYQFTLPTDCLRILRPAEAALDWLVEGRKLLTNDGDTLYLRYLADITDPTQFDAAFVDLLTLALARVMCEPLTNSTGKRQLLDGEYREACSDARKANAFEQGPVDSPDDSFWLARL